MKPLVSICCITYNHEKYIREAIEGFLMQKTNFDFEIIIGEDFSDDETANIVIEYANKYPNLIKAECNAQNIGTMPNFFKTLQKATGKYIALCEGDDYWTDPCKLQKQVDFLENNPDYGFIYCDYDRLYQKSGVIIKNYLQTQKYVIEDGDIFDKLMNFQSTFVYSVTVMFRKSILDANFDYNAIFEKNWKLGDLPLLLTFAKHSKIKYLNESTATYRVLEDSASNTKNYVKKHELHKSIYDVFTFYAEKYNCSDEVKRNILIRQNKSFLKDAFFLKDRRLSKMAKQELKKLGSALSFRECLWCLLTRFGFINTIVLYLYRRSNA